METEVFGNHNAFGHVIILATMLDDIIMKKLIEYNNNNNLKKKDFVKQVLKDKMNEKDYELMSELVELRNNLAHDCIKEPAYSRLFSGNIHIRDNQINFDALVDQKGKEIFDVKFVKISSNLPINFIQEHNGKHLFASVYFYLVGVVEKIEIK